MKNLLLTSTLAALVIGAAPTFAAEFGSGSHIAGAQAFEGLGDADGIFDRRGRGRGRGGDDDRSGGSDDDRDDDDHGGGGRGGDDDGTSDQGGGNDDDDGADDNGGDRDRDDDEGGRDPRVPGGSGCDDPDDLIEHPECARPAQ